MERTRAKTENMDIALKGQCSRGDRSFKHDLNKKRKMEKKKIPFYFRNEKIFERTWKKEIPKVAVFVRKAKRPTMLPRSEGAIAKDIRMRLLASTRVFTLQNPKVDAHGVRACLSTETKLVKTKNGDATVGIRVEETKVLNGVLEDGQGDTFSARCILKQIGWSPPKKQFWCDIVAMRQDTSAQEKDKDLHWLLFSGDERVVAI